MPPETVNPVAAQLCKSETDFLLESSGNLPLGKTRWERSKKKTRGGGNCAVPQEALSLRILTDQWLRFALLPLSMQRKTTSWLSITT